MKTLIVDDSIVFRSAITQALETVDDIDILKAVSNGALAMDYLNRNPEVDLITLDMEMPVMDGMETIKAIRKINTNVSIIVFSSFTKRGAEKTIEALNVGADDFVEKVEGTGSIDGSVKMIREELLPRIQALKTRKFPREQIKRVNDKKESNNSKNIETIVRDMKFKPKLICIGCSTGGPEALTKIFKNITEEISVPMLVVQHMPPMFTQKLAEMLNNLSPVEVREAKDGDSVKPGLCLIAPGDYHMELTADMKISLNQNEKECFVRPAVNVLFNSVSNYYASQVLSIVLTGMGDDGAKGCVSLDKKGAYQFVQDEESCIVWGMPGAVVRTGISPTILKLDQFSSLINLVSKRI